MNYISGWIGGLATGVACHWAWTTPNPRGWMVVVVCIVFDLRRFIRSYEG